MIRRCARYNSWKFSLGRGRAGLQGSLPRRRKEDIRGPITTLLIDFTMAHHLKLVRVDGDIVAILPAGLVEELRLVDGDELTVLRDGAGYRLVKKTDQLAAELAAFEEGRERFRDVLRRLAEDD
jgi:hypothetical protein